MKINFAWNAKHKTKNKMVNVTKVLSDEHKNILKIIDYILIECDKIESGKPVNKKFFEKAIDFIRNYADKFHHAKEEDILFKELCGKDVSMHCNPVDQMLYEHDMGRNYVKGMAEALKENNKEKLIENATGYAMLLKEHIGKEDEILYPMSEEVLNEEKKNLINKKYKIAEEKKKSDKEKYLKFVNNLK